MPNATKLKILYVVTKHGMLQRESKGPANINIYLRENLTSSGLILSKWRTVEASTRETSGNSNQIVEMEEEQMYTEIGFLYHRETRFQLEPPKTRQKRKTKREVDENDKGGTWNSRKDLEKGQGNSWRHNLLLLLLGGPMLWSGIIGNWLDCNM